MVGGRRAARGAQCHRVVAEAVTSDEQAAPAAGGGRSGAFYDLFLHMDMDFI